MKSVSSGLAFYEMNGLNAQKRKRSLKDITHLQMTLHFIVGETIHLHKLSDLLRGSNCRECET